MLLYYLFFKTSLFGSDRIYSKKASFPSLLYNTHTTMTDPPTRRRVVKRRGAAKMEKGKTPMETALIKLCGYVRLVIDQRASMYVRVSGFDRRGRRLVSLRMRGVFNTKKTNQEIARDACRSLEQVLQFVKGWTVEVCPACIPRTIQSFKKGELRRTGSPGKVWARLSKDMWVLARYEGFFITPTMSYIEGYRVCTGWSESHTMAGMYAKLSGLVDELENRVKICKQLVEN